MAGTITRVPARDYFMVYKLHIYMEIQPNAFATELARIIIAKIGQRYLIMTTNIFFLRNAVGGDPGEERTFYGDPDYEAMRNL